MSRIADGVTRPAPITVEIDGAMVPAHPGETLAAVMIAAGAYRMRDDRSGAPRGLLCNMGTCSECFVWIAMDGAWRRRRACLTLVSEGLCIATQEGQP
ncbi:sarcosine oxidase subunit alpha [Novosphingobium sp. SG751A]|uniref:(2Fe-2S)-binding protein n=1 Tax=Novosphingobium sp. SG751A TaxID=2587000 RepID=UPI001557C454|nr:(2Fe-2S)-binding protein [Novosphingobium sp. SG751A]NOW47392.1 sarcosine oxidase subunit alpha [Novosphingobium sp. SG751A]